MIIDIHYINQTVASQLWGDWIDWSKTSITWKDSNKSSVIFFLLSQKKKKTVYTKGCDFSLFRKNVVFTRSKLIYFVFITPLITAVLCRQIILVSFASKHWQKLWSKDLVWAKALRNLFGFKHHNSSGVSSLLFVLLSVSWDYINITHPYKS